MGYAIMMNIPVRLAPTAPVKKAGLQTEAARLGPQVQPYNPVFTAASNTYQADTEAMNPLLGSLDSKVAFETAQGFQRKATYPANASDDSENGGNGAVKAMGTTPAQGIPASGQLLNVQGVTIDTTGLTNGQVQNIQKSLQFLAADVDGAKLLKELQGDGYTIKFDPDYNRLNNKNSNAYFNGPTKVIGVTEKFWDKSFSEQTGILGHEMLHAATPGSNSKTEEGLAEVVEGRIAARASGRQLSESEEQMLFAKKYTADAYEDLPADNRIVSSLENLGIQFRWDVAGRAQFLSTPSRFNSVYSPTEKETLNTLTTNGNFELTAGNDGNAKTISMADIKAQIQADEALIKSPDFFTTRSAEEAAKVFMRHNSLKNLEANLNNYTQSGEIDLPTLLTAIYRTS